jgi:NAD(P)-dependent dehydrogenase (short-subunit alcohol dehydrogenase family)
MNICSVGSYLATSGMASYCASKFSLEAFSDCFRREMTVWGLRVSIIEPGSMRTPMTDGLLNAVTEMWSGLLMDIKERWVKIFINILLFVIDQDYNQLYFFHFH